MAKQHTASGKCSYASVLVGVYAMVASHSISTQWGNMSVYVLSFFHFRVSQDMTDSATWIVAVNFIGWNLGMLSCEKTVGLVGRRGALLVITLLAAASTSLTFLAVQHSFAAFLFTYPFLLGISFGMGHGLQIMYSTIWVSPQYHGMACCSIFSLNMVGSLVMNVVVTWFINPRNLTPDFKVHDGKGALFSYPELLDRVPRAFLVHGAISLSLLTISFALIREKHENKEKKEKEERVLRDEFGICKKVEYDAMKKSLTNIWGLENNEDEKGCDVFERKRGRSNGVDPTSGCMCTEQTAVVDSRSKDQRPVINLHLEIANSSDMAMKEDVTPREDMPRYSRAAVTHAESRDAMQANSSGVITNSEDVEPDTNQQDVTPKQALRTREFYALFIMTLCADACFMTFYTYYKIFGMMYYQDDHLFTGLSVSISLVMIVLNTLVGLACDTLGVKNTLVACSGSLCVMVAFFYVSVLLNKWLYSGCVAILLSLNFVAYHISSFCCVYYFGRTHSTTICGMAMSVMYASNMGIPFLVQAILNSHSHSGWYNLFMTMNIFTMGYLLTVVLGLPAVSRVRAVTSPH